MKKSGKTIEQLLNKIGYKHPSGNIFRESEIGSGSYFYFAPDKFSEVTVTYAGNEPQDVVDLENFDHNSEVLFRLTSPSVVCVKRTYHGDRIHSAGSYNVIIFFCATDEQIAEAQKKISAESDPEMPNLKTVLKGDWRHAESHRRQYHSQGCCWKGQSNDPCDAFIAIRVFEMLSGLPRNTYYTLRDEAFMQEHLSLEATNELRLAMSFVIPEERLKVYRVAKLEYEAEEKANKKAFALLQIENLVGMGFSRGWAVNIMKAVGPGLCINAVEWAQYALNTIGSVDALDCLLSGAGGTNGFGKDRMEAALRAFGLEPPSVSSSAALFTVLAGAKVALLSGIMSADAETEVAA